MEVKVVKSTMVPAFEAQYVAVPEKLCLPFTEEMFTMELPTPTSFRYGVA
jgi:hypothetical protein